MVSVADTNTARLPTGPPGPDVFTEVSSDFRLTEKQVHEAKINQAIIEWFESWQQWQQRILVSGIVNRFNESQLHSLLVAVEPVYHRDFVAGQKKIYPIKHGEQLSDVTAESRDGKINRKTYILKKQIQNSSKRVDFEEPLQQHEENATEESTTGTKAAIPKAISQQIVKMAPFRLADARGSRSTRRSSSADSKVHQLSTIEEAFPKKGGKNSGKSEDQGGSELEELEVGADEQDAMTSHLVSHLMSEVHSSGASQVSTLVSSLSPIEETSPEDSSYAATPAGQEEELGFGQLYDDDAEPKDENKRKKKKKKKRKKVNPDAVVEKMVNSRAWAERVLQSASNTSLEPAVQWDESATDFHSGITSVDVQADDFFQTNKGDVLGKPVSTRSKIGSAFMHFYDKERNKVPIPTTQQLYKSKKLWNSRTVKPKTGRLKEQFREQLAEIWKWIADWPAHQRIRLLLQLFCHSGEGLVKYAAECVKHKSQQLEDMKTSIDCLTDPMLIRIFQFLDPFDLLQSSYVCRRWNYILQNDAVWRNKCNDIGLAYGIPNLVGLLVNSAGGNWTLDWKKACEEVYAYLRANVEPVRKTEEAEMEEEEEEWESEEEEIPPEERFKDYVPYWKLHPPKGKEEETTQSVRYEGTPFDQALEDAFARHIKDVDLGDEADYACFEVDMFPDLQEWSDVGLMANIGKRFAVDYHDEQVIKECERTWPIRKHVIKVRKVMVLKGHTGSVNVIKYDTNRIFSGSVDRDVRVWSRLGECFAKMRIHKGGINDISLCPMGEGRVLYTASWDMSARVWNSVSFKPKSAMTGHRGSVTRIAADGKFIVTCSHDGSIRVWNRNTLKCERTITSHLGEIECMVYHDRQIFTGGIDRKIYLHNSFTGRMSRTFQGHNFPVTALKKQHDLLVSGDMLGHVFFWNLQSENDDWPEEQLTAHESKINAIVMHGPTFFTASDDALVKEWDILTLMNVRVFQGHTDGVTDVEWSDKFLLTASRDNDIRMWWWKGTQDEEEKEKEEAKKNKEKNEERNKEKKKIVRKK